MRRLRVIKGWKDLPDGDRGAALAMGNFDGVHRGHQQVIALAAKAAGQLGCQLGVITFDPHPRAYFRPDEPAFLLMKPDQQARALEALGVDVLYVLPFSPEFAHLTDREFAEEVLHKGLGARHVAAGFDITFGKDRTGDPEALAQALLNALNLGATAREAVARRARAHVERHFSMTQMTEQTLAAYLSLLPE